MWAAKAAQTEQWQHTAAQLAMAYNCHAAGKPRKPADFMPISTTDAKRAPAVVKGDITDLKVFLKG